MARWLGDIREFFPAPVVQVIQNDAIERPALSVDADGAGVPRRASRPMCISIADLISLRAAMPAKAKDTARIVVAKVVDGADEEARAEDRRDRSAARSTARAAPRASAASPTSTGRAPSAPIPTSTSPSIRTVIPERLIGYRRHAPVASSIIDRASILCVDQSGSMATSVVYSSIFAAVMASLPVIATAAGVLRHGDPDLTDELADPVEVLFGVQLGGGTDINAALAYCETQDRAAGEDASGADQRSLRGRQRRRDAGAAPRRWSRAAST